MTNHSRKSKHQLPQAALAAILALPWLAADARADGQGVKVYLSPSSQHGNVGCNGYVEAVGALKIAEAAASVLNDNGYEVMIGHGDPAANTKESNDWGADLHIPIHSNARGGDNCEEGVPPDHGGTWVLYRDAGSKGQQLAAAILAALQSQSPGTKDKLDRSQELIELNATHAIAAYVEVGFHTYLDDVLWMSQPAAAGAALAAGIDAHCLAHGC